LTLKRKDYLAMKSYLPPIQVLVCLVVMAVSVSCDDSEKSATQPQVVRKQLVGQNERVKPAPEADAVLAAKRAAEVAAQEKQPEATRSAVKQKETAANTQTTESLPLPTPAPPVPKPNEPTPPTRAGEDPPVPSQTTVASAAAPTLIAEAATLGKAGEQILDIFMTDQEVADLLKIERPPPYSKTDKIDPFLALVRVRDVGFADGEKRVKRRTPTTPLEKMELGQFKLVAIISTDKGGKLAMVEEQSGKGYSIRIGTFIGTNSGKVSDIQGNKVVIEEEYENNSGKIFTEKKELTLPKPPGEM
jgi:Tfp pilus assembly protein PilP